jgi:UDP-N-acetylglucosamine 3-dehydrogenase
MRKYEEDGLRFGLIGGGDIGRLRGEALLRGPHRLTAVADLDAARAAAAAAPNGAAHTTAWRTLLERDDVDAVIVSTPPLLHEEMVVAALESGKHVLCEKPLGRSVEECRAMLDAAEHAGRVLATGFNYRFYPSFSMARDLLARGEIGELSHIRAYGGYSATGHNQAWVHDAEVVGGGALHDIGIHMIDLTRSFLGDVVSVAREASGSVWNFEGCEDNGFLLMRSSTGRIASLHASWTEWGRYHFSIELVGSHGAIRASCFPMRLQVRRAEHTGGRARTRVHRFPAVFLGEHLRSYRWVVVRSFVEEHDAFARLVRGEPSPIATGLDGLRAIAIARGATALDSVRESSASGAAT